MAGSNTCSLDELLSRGSRAKRQASRDYENMLVAFGLVILTTLATVLEIALLTLASHAFT